MPWYAKGQILESFEGGSRFVSRRSMILKGLGNLEKGVASIPVDLPYVSSVSNY